MKYAWIDTHRDEFELAPMCEALTVSMSGYRAWKGGGSPTRTRLTDTQMLALIQAIHQELKGELPSVFRLPTQRHYAANCCSC
ncbi:MAG: hypothetical protein IPH41_09865 [Sulfuritalea sp.]|nr:hypothetical protein [Sulfuritalea sp.]